MRYCPRLIIKNVTFNGADLQHRTLLSVVAAIDQCSCLSRIGGLRAELLPGASVAASATRSCYCTVIQFGAAPSGPRIESRRHRCRHHMRFNAIGGYDRPDNCKTRGPWQTFAPADPATERHRIGWAGLAPKEVPNFGKPTMTTTTVI